MIRTFGNDIEQVFTGGHPVKAVYSYGVKVWPDELTPQIFPIAGFSGYSIRTGWDIWKDLDGNIYYSGDLWPTTTGTRFGDFILSDGVWVKLDTQVSDFQYGRYVWTDGEDVYMDRYGGTHKKLVNGEWTDYTPILDGHSTSAIDGSDVWEGLDGHLYCDHYIYGHFRYAGSGTWETYTPKKTNDSTFETLDGSEVWIYDGVEYAYARYSTDSSNYATYRHVNGKWQEWAQYDTSENRIKPDGLNVWTDYDGNTYWSNAENQFRKTSDDRHWHPVMWTDFNPQGGDKWTDNDGNIYFTVEGQTYLLKR